MADIVFNHDMRAAFIGINRLGSLQVVDDIAANDRAGLDAQRVNAAHVLEPAETEMMNMIFLDEIVLRDAVPKTPDPADRDGAVVKVVDVIVRYHVAERMFTEHADSLVKDTARVMNVIVRDEFFASAPGE